MPYSVELPDGTLVADIPDDMPQDEVRRRILTAFPQFAPKTRTMGEAVTDIGAQFKGGIGKLAQFPGQLYGLATGDFSDTGLYGYGKEMEAAAEAAKSPGLKAREAARAQAIAEAEKTGQISAGITAAKETITDPALFLGLIAENIPGMIIPAGAAAGVGRAALQKGLAKGVETAAAREAAITAGRQAAVGAGAVQQGADVGTGAYEEVYKRLVSQGMSEPEAAAEAINRARAAGVAGGVISLLAQRLPGARKLEEVLAGRTTGAGLGRAVLGGAAGEALGETAEEVGGKLAQNVALRTVDPTQALTAGLGETAGMAALAGAGLGGLGGGVSAMRGTPEAAGTADAARQQAQQRILEARERERVKAEGETPIGAMGPYMQEQYGQLEQEKQQLMQGPQAPNVKERIAEITKQQKQMTIAAITRGREEKAQQESEAAKAAASAFSQPEVRETPEGQGELFTQFEAPPSRVQPEPVPAPVAPQAEVTTPPEQMELGLPVARGTSWAQKELDLLKAGPKTPESRARMEDLKGFLKEESDRSKELAARGYTAQGQGRLFTPTEMRESGLERGKEPLVAEPKPTTPRQMERAGQGAFKFEAPKAEAGVAGITTPEARKPLEPIAPVPPVSEAVPEPKLAPKRVVPPELQPVIDSLTAAGVRPETKRWAENGRHRPFLRKLVSMSVMAPEARQAARKALKLEEGSHKAEVFDALFPTPGVPAFEPAAGAGKPSVGIPSKPGPVTPAEPGAAGAGETVGRGVVPTGGAAPTPAAPKIGAKPTLEAGKPVGKTAEVDLYRGVPAGQEGRKTVGGATFMSPDKAIADAYAGPTGQVSKGKYRFKNLLDVQRWTDAKQALGLPPSATMEDIVNTAREARYDGVSFNTTNGKEYIVIGAAPKAAEPTPKKVSLKEAEAAWEENNVEGAGTRLAFKDLSSERKKMWKDAVEDGTATIEQYEKTAKRQADEVKAEKRKTVVEDEGEELPNAPVDRNELIRRAQSAAQRQQGALKRIAKAFKDGTLDERGRQFDSYTAENAAEELRTVRDQLEATKREPNTAEDFVATIAKEAAKGNVDRSLVKFTNWLYANKPNLLEGIRLQVLSRPETESTGTFNGLAKLLRLHKETGGVESPETLAHELTHSAELMMSDAQQLQLINEWRKLMVAQMKRDNNKKTPNKEFWNAVMENLVAPTKDRQEKVLELLPDYSYYQYTSPSEYWAVNGGKILQAAAEGTPLFRFKLFLQQMLASIKSFLGKEANPAVIKMAREVLLNPSERTNKNMLASRYRLSIGKEAAAEISLPSAPSPTEGIAETSELMKEAPGEFKTAVKDFVRIFTEKDDVSYVTRFRTEIADSKASAVNRMNILFDGAVRDELTGVNNPEQLIRQAEDPSALFTAFMNTGGLEKDPTSGRYVATDKAGPGGSIADMLAAVKNWSDANGMDFNLAYAEASKLIEARRLDNMRQANEQIKETAKKAGVKAELFPIHKLSQKDKYDRTADEQIDAALRGLKANPEIQAVADMMDKQRAYMIDHMVAVGRISKETAQEWKDAAGYVPFDRVEDFFDKYVPRRTTGRGIAQLGSLPKFVGSTEREVGNVLNNHVKLMGWMLTQTLKQDAGSTTLNLLADMGQARRLHGNKLAANNAGNVVRSYKNGREEFFEMRSRYDVKAFLDAPEPKLAIVKMFAQVSNILRKLVTVMPPFIAKQVTDDIQRGFVTSGVKSPSRLIIPAVTNFLRIAGHEVVFGKDHPFTKEFAKKGLGGNIDYNANNPAETVLFSLGYSKRGWLSELHHRLESITRASDLAMRKAIYDRTMVEENKDVALATARAQEFINFRRRGASTTINLGVATVPFFNAYLQSSDLLLRSMFGRGSSTTEKAVARRLFWTQAAKMTGFALIYSLANSDDEEYQKQTLAERSNNWIIGGKELPVPGDMAAMFKVPVEVLVQYMARQGTEKEQLTSEAVKQVLGYAYEQYVGRVTPVPQAIRPVAEALMNHSLLTGRELVGTYQQGMPKPLQTTATTSELAKAIATFAFNNIKDPVTDTPLQLSPIVIDNTLRGYLGGAVPLMNMLIDQLLNPNKTDRPLSQYWFISQYLTPEVPTGPKEEFYDLVNKVMPVKRALAQLEKTDMAAAMAYYEKNKDNLLMAELVNKALQDIEQSRAYIKYLDSAEGAKAIESSAERLKMKQEVERFENKNLEWVRSAKAQIFGKKE